VRAPAQVQPRGLAIAYEIDATVSADLASIQGTLRARVRNGTGAPLEILDMWLYPNAFAEELPGITDANRIFYAPFRDPHGGIAVEGLRVDGAAVEAPTVHRPPAPGGSARALLLPEPLQPGGTAVVELTFHTLVPHRLGPLSRARGVLTALGGWHPWFTAPTDQPLDRLPPRADWRIRLRAPEDHLALVGGFRASLGAIRLDAREWVDLVVRPASVKPLAVRGGAVWPLSNAPKDEWEKSSEPDPPPLPSVWVGNELAWLLERMDRWADVRADLPDPGPIQMVVVPMRSEIALATPGIVAVSDRAFGVTPLNVIRAFHARGIARAYFARRLHSLSVGCEPPATARLVADALGARLADRFIEETFGSTADVATLLGPFDFIPNVDDFLRSPRAPFAHVYFQPVADPIPVRDEPWTFNNPTQRGKLLFAKLEDRLGPDLFAELIERYLAGYACPLQRGAEELAGEDLDDFFAAWMGERPREDLRVRIVSTEERADGSWRSEVEVRRVGDAPPERIETAAWEEDGDRHLLVWTPAEGEREKRFVVVADAPITRLQVDPRGRVAQTPAEPGELAALGDRVPSRIQVLLTGFSLTYSTADQTVFGDIDVLLRSRETVRRRLGMGFSVRPARLQARTSLNFGFGPLVGAARYAWNWGVGLSADYLRPGFGGEDVVEGFAAGPSLGISFDDRPIAASPLRGTAFAAGFSLSAGANRGGESAVYSTVSAGALRLFPLGPRSTFAVRLKGSVILGDPPVQELIPLGGSDAGLRGFPLEAALSEQRYVASAEWRHPLVPDMDVDFGLARLRQISGAAFVDAAYANELVQLVPGLPVRHLFADAGYGLRFEYDLLGVRPLTLAVDAAVPFNRGSAVDVAPVVFSFRAGQSFASP